MTELHLHDGRVLRTTLACGQARARVARGGRLAFPIGVGVVFVTAAEVAEIVVVPGSSLAA